MRWRISGLLAEPFAFAAAMIASSSCRKPICCPSVETPRSNASSPIATCQPLPGVETRFSAAVRAPSKKVSLNSASPLICRIGRIVIPGWSIGMRRKVRPFGPFDPSSLRVTTKIQSQICARLVQIFWPSTTHSPVASSTRARVRTEARSDPAFGSE